MTASEAWFEELLQQVASDDPAVVDRAHRFALGSLDRDPRVRVLAATAFDRARAFAGKEQKFGTQALLRSGLPAPWPVDGRTTDSERAKWGIGPLAQFAERLDAAPRIGKQPLRRLLRARRSALDPSTAAAAAATIAAYGVAALAARARGGVVAAYWPLPGEVDPLPLARALAAASGATLALPVVDGERMHFRAFAGDHELVPAGFGTRGPSAAAPVVHPKVVLAPLLGFDATGARLGQGKGYYDRTLAAGAAAASRPLVVGVAFACQQLPGVPTEAHDLHLDAVVTEHGLQHFVASSA